MAEEATVDFGTYLRQAREKRGISLQQVSATTKISARVLDALEHNDPRKLPGGIFSRAFVRSYAREVGLDPEVVVAQFVATFPDHAGPECAPATTGPDDPEAFESHRRAATTFLQLLGVSLVIVVLVLIYLSMRRSEPKAEQVVSEPAPVQQTAPPPLLPPAPAAQSPAPPAAQPAASTVVTPGPATSTSPGGAPAAAAVVPAPPAVTPSTGAPTSTAPLTIGIVSSAACWLSVTVDGNRVLSRTLDPGERLTYPARSAVTLTAGNAGALSITLNGKPARSLGGAGQVVTTTITPDTLKSFLQQP